jgi:two-component system sensor histidine kinase CpxA
MRRFIFLWFVISVLLVGATSLVTVIWTGPSALLATWEFYGSDLVQYGCRLAANALDSGGVPALNAFEKQVDPAGSMQFYVFDSELREIRARQAPDSIRNFASHLQPQAKVQFLVPFRGLYAGSVIRTHDARDYRIVIWFPSRRAPGIPIRGWGWLGRLTAIFGSAGLLCSWLAWRLSSPLARLRQAARSFATGNLTARAGAATFPGNPPEYRELASDFDDMASRIETLLNSQRQLLRDVSHELRSPLTRLSLAVSNARSAPPAAVERSLDRIDQESERLNSLIDRIIRLSRLETLTATPRSDVIEFADFIESIVSDANFEATAKKRKVSILRAETCRLAGDREMLREAIENVVRNAIRYTPEGTSVMVDAYHAGGGEYHVVVRDQGPGVPPENLPAIFDAFYRAPQRFDPESPGFGLGLAIARRTVSLHRGSIAARNLPERGFEVAIHLPAPAGRPFGASAATKET